MSRARKIKPGSKRESVLRVFLERGEAGLNCFEAVRFAHDYVLRTTVSELNRDFGITFNKRYEQVPGHAGSKADCVRYSLTLDGAAKARALLDPATTTPAPERISSERWQRAVRAAEQERRDRAARSTA